LERGDSCAVGRGRAGEESCMYVVCFFLGNPLASEFYKLTFRNTLSVPTDRVFRNVGI
jgi:hypothetical protein